MFFIKIAEFVNKRYKLILLLTLVLTALSLYFVSKLRLNMQLMEMLPQDRPSIVAYKNAIENFEGIDMISVVIEGYDKDIISYINGIKDELQKVPNVDKVMYKNEDEFYRKYGLLLLKEREMESIEGMLTASSIKDFVKGINDNFEKEYIAGEDSDKLSDDSSKVVYFINTIEDFLNLLNTSKAAKYETKRISDEFLIGPKYVLSGDRTMGLIFIKSTISITDVMELIPLVNEIEKIVKGNQEKYNVRAGLAGFVVLQRDEMAATERDMTVSFILSLILILIIFIIGFRLIRYSILSIIPLLVGICWAMGLTYVFIGSLNPFTAMMGAILIGLGIDYAIHIIALYTEERYKGTSVPDSITKVYEKSVKGIITGSVTTAIGFMMFVFSSFPAFREFGFTLGIGILCTLVTSVFVLPSLLIIFGRKDVKRGEKRHYIVKFYEKTAGSRPKYVIAFILILVILSALKYKSVEFSSDIKDIEPKGLESLKLNDKIIEKFDFSNDVTLGIAHSLEEAHKIKEEAEDMDTIGFIESIANYIPVAKEQDKRLKNIRMIKNKIELSCDRNLYLDDLKNELLRLEDNIIEISDLSFMAGEHKIVGRCDELINSGIIKKTADNTLKNRDIVRRVQEPFIQNLKLFVMNTESKKHITIEDLPENIRDSYIGKDGTFLTTIYPKGDLWNGKFQDIYVEEIKSMDAALTGSSMMNIEIMDIAAEEGKRILILVIFAIYIVLILDFRNFKYATFAMIPMVLTLALVLGVMGWFKIKFDYVNIIALPIIIGIGVDDGVHLIHRYLIERKLINAIISTGRGIFLTTVTTMAAFGTMILSTYQGFASFGKLLILGIGFAYVSTIFLVSALIRVTEKDS